MKTGEHTILRQIGNESVGVIKITNTSPHPVYKIYVNNRLYATFTGKESFVWCGLTLKAVWKDEDLEVS